jgi:anthranilate synthase/phosphoribosyltransferase
MILFIDNYDSFTFNLVQYVGELGAEPRVFRNDALTVEEAAALGPRGVIISPGPGTPHEAGISMDLIRRLPPEIPILGVCLGHQAIGAAFGGSVGRAPKPVHGKTASIRHDGSELYRGVRNPFRAGRYHSLVVSADGLPGALQVTARTDDGLVMGLRHRERPVHGVQFHPESILTDDGKILLANFLRACGEIPRMKEGIEIREAIARVARGEPLGRAGARAAMGTILSGEATPAQIAGLVLGLRVRGEALEEIVGFVEAMRAAAVPLDRPRPEAIDLCGTGGDGAGTFNISTAASLVAAACGLKVAKHGNRSISSRSGSADVLEALGIPIDLPVDRTAASIDEVGFGFLFAPRYHPAMHHAAGPRRELGVRTVFNILGPMTNPAGARRQLLGVYDDALRDVVARVLLALGSESVWVVHSKRKDGGGLDEIGLEGPTRVSAVGGGAVREFEVRPEDAGLRTLPTAALGGGDAAENARRILAVLGGEAGAERDAVILNAAAALVIGGVATDLRAGAAAAAEAIDGGRARKVVEELRRRRCPC